MATNSSQPFPANDSKRSTDFIALMSAGIAIEILFIILTSLTTIIRLYTKLTVSKSQDWEDYTMYLAAVGFTAYSILGIIACRLGMQMMESSVDTSVTYALEFAQQANVTEILYPPLIFLAKLSILLQFIHIFIPNRRSRTWWLVQVFTLLNLLWFTAAFLISIFQCTPRAKIWNSSLQGQCINYPSYIIITGVFNMVSDLIMLIMPAIWIWQLQMSTRRKIGVSAVFAIGVVACVVSILRIYYSVENLKGVNSAYTLSQVAICTSGEIAAGILCGNLPVFPKFFSYFGPKVTKVLNSYRTLKPNDTATPPGTWAVIRDAEPLQKSSERRATPRDWLDMNEIRSGEHSAA